MYYKGVNRGLSFTKPGVYTFALILFVGLAAVATGVNGLFVFLSVGLGGFIISGLLSERAMRSSYVTSVSAAMADANAPFEVMFTIENRSAWFTVYSMRAMFMLQQPKFRLIAHEMAVVAGVRLTRVPPGSTQTYSVQATGMPRGEYREILATQLTTFPFGILEKFKLGRVPASLIVAPEVDRVYLAEARADVRRRYLAGDADLEFFAHRPYVARDSLRHIDWKKSAGHGPGDWVVKTFRTEADHEPVRVVEPWASIKSERTEGAYEGRLSKIRTYLKALDEAQKPYVLDLEDGRAADGRDAALALLAGLPAYARRDEGAPRDASRGVRSA